VSGQLIGVGVGPGDPELITLKAVRVLGTADAVLVPVMAGNEQETGRAEATVLAHVPADRVLRVPFALNDRGGVTAGREQAWDAAAHAVLAAFDRGAATVAFPTSGHPNDNATWVNGAQPGRGRPPDVVVATVPGITAMQDLAARSGTVLVEGRETLTLMPITAGVEAFDAALAGRGTVVAYKGWRRTHGMVEALRRHDRLDLAVSGERLGLPDERIGPLADTALPYLSTVLVPARRGRRGEKL
jgi:precorrin-2/cobalt-factor-2 C20-methyltransferase